MRKFDDLVKSPLWWRPEWATDNAPDTQSMIAAVRVEMLLAAGDPDPVNYIVDEYGETREHAAQIVANCRVDFDLG